MSAYLFSTLHERECNLLAARTMNMNLLVNYDFVINSKCSVIGINQCIR